jgi:hypothetical protein
MQCQGIQFLWQCKYQVIVRAGQQVCFPALYPFFPFMPLTLGTVPVTATVIADTDIAAIITGIYVTAEGSCSALPEGSEGFLLMNGK